MAPPGHVRALRLGHGTRWRRWEYPNLRHRLRLGPLRRRAGDARGQSRSRGRRRAGNASSGEPARRREGGSRTLPIRAGRCRALDDGGTLRFGDRHRLLGLHPESPLAPCQNSAPVRGPVSLCLAPGRNMASPPSKGSTHSARLSGLFLPAGCGVPASRGRRVHHQLDQRDRPTVLRRCAPSPGGRATP